MFWLGFLAGALAVIAACLIGAVWFVIQNFGRRNSL
jgi:hypothetical protein